MSPMRKSSLDASLADCSPKPTPRSRRRNLNVVRSGYSFILKANVTQPQCWMNMAMYEQSSRTSKDCLLVSPPFVFTIRSLSLEPLIHTSFLNLTSFLKQNCARRSSPLPYPDLEFSNSFQQILAALLKTSPRPTSKTSRSAVRRSQYHHFFM